MGEGVVEAEVPAFGGVVEVAGGEALQAGDITVIGRDNDGCGVGVENGEAAANFPGHIVDIADVCAGVRPDKELIIDAHIDTVVVAVGNHQAVGDGHRTEVDEVEAATGFCLSSLAGTRIVGRRIAGRWWRRRRGLEVRRPGWSCREFERWRSRLSCRTPDRNSEYRRYRHLR